MAITELPAGSFIGQRTGGKMMLCKVCGEVPVRVPAKFARAKSTTCPSCKAEETRLKKANSALAPFGVRVLSDAEVAELVAQYQADNKANQ